MVNAVSLRLFSIAIAWRTSSASHASSGMTAAGLPVNGRSAKASTWTIRSCVIQSFLILGEIGLGERVAGLVDMSFGVDVDDDLATGELRLELALDLVHHMMGILDRHL